MTNPLPPALLPVADTGFAAPPAREPCRILVATNDNAHRQAVGSFLLSRGHSFVAADSPQDVMMHLRSGAFDLVVTALADSDGFELMRLVRQTMPGFPVIMVALGGSGLDGAHLDCATGLRHEIFGDPGVVAARLASLTTRERQVLNLIVAGRANKVIAHELSISPRTVENHRARVMEKLRVKSVAELVRLALSAEDLAAGRAARFAAGNDTARRATA